MKEKKAVRITVSLPTTDHALLEALAESDDVSLSWLARKAIANYLDERKEELQLGLQFQIGASK